MRKTDQQIIHLLHSGDQRAIDLLYDRYANPLFGMLQQMLPDESAAQDVLQDSFIKVWKKGKQYDATKATLFTWLMRIARNTALDYLRAKKTRGDHEIQAALRNVGEVQQAIQPEHLDVPTHLAKLELKYGQVIHALFFLGLSQQETSEHLNIPLGTVKSRLRVGLRELRKIFADKRMMVLSNLFIISMFSIDVIQKLQI